MLELYIFLGSIFSLYVVTALCLPPAHKKNHLISERKHHVLDLKHLVLCPQTQLKNMK